MGKYFNFIKEKVCKEGIKLREGVWKLDSCTYSVLEGGAKERLHVPSLIDIVKSGESYQIVEGSEDSLKFLSMSI